MAKLIIFAAQLLTLISIQNIRTSEYTYDLPQERIALFPADKRDQSKLLIYDEKGNIGEDLFKNVAKYIPEQSHLFYNNSRVIPARLNFTTSSGSTVEIFCLKPLHPAEYQKSFSAYSSCIWECMIGNARRFKEPVLKLMLALDNKMVELSAQKVFIEGNTGNILFSWNNPGVSFGEVITAAGRTPLPPYIKRKVVPSDRERYQTIYSSIDGSVAAPTAGLHFTDEVFGSLREKNILFHEITLHVGAGTFQPVKSEYVSGHVMHAEHFEVSYELIKELTGMNHRVTCVGTTTVRALESLYWMGAKILQNEKMPPDLTLEQWEPYSTAVSRTTEAFGALHRWFDKAGVEKTMATTSLMIVPGYQFKVTDRLITNFHQPGSSLLLLIAAFVGDRWKQIYQHALDNNFRFLSYGDSSILSNSSFEH